MGQARKYSIGLLAVACFAMAAKPLSAFDFFGVFGGSDDAEQVEIFDPLSYDVALNLRTSDDDLRRAIAAASVLNQRRDQPASGTAGLLAAARGDYRRILAALYNAGHYGGTIRITAGGREIGEIPLSTRLSGPVAVAIDVDPGPLFRFGSVGFENAPPPITDERDVVPTEARQAFRRGAPARASVIADATDEAIAQWRELGFPKAKRTGRDVVADHARKELDARVTLDPGRAARMGPVRIEGQTRMRASFLRYITEIPEGAQFDPRYAQRARERLNRLRVFQSARVEEADEVLPDGSLPFIVTVTDRKPRRLGFGGTFSSLDGAGVEAFWLHRNLAGRAERLRFDAAVNGIGNGNVLEDYDYRLGVTVTRPGVIEPDTTLIARAEVLQDNFDTYSERSGLAGLGLERIVNENLTLGTGVELRFSDIDDPAGSEQFTLLSVYANATYDRRDDPLDARNGFFLTGEARPFYGINLQNSGIRAEAELRGFRALSDRFVLAGRATLGSIVGADRTEIPENLLFFSGGGGSVRGFEFRSNGVDVGGQTFGGRGLFELSGEVRARVTENIGLVGFADAGWVSDGAWAFDDDDPRVGLGLGLRYRTGVGPIRLDIATPLDRRAGESSVALLPRHRAGVLIRLVAILLLLAGVAVAQDDTREDNGFIIRFIEDQLSTDTRRIRLRGISGALSSKATVERITISDADGIWLQIDNAAIDWNRAALFDSKVEIERLAAERITITRQPAAENTLPSAEAKATPFRLPELPVALTLKALEIETLALDEALFGYAANLQVTGAFELADGALTAALDTTSLDRAGDRLKVEAAYKNDAALSIDLDLAEARNGLFSNLAAIPGRPALDLRISGAGPLEDLGIDLVLSADGAELVRGDLALRQQGDDQRMELSVGGDLQPLVAAEFRPFFGGSTSLRAAGTRRGDGGFALDGLQIDNAALSLTGRAEVAADGFLSALQLAGRLGQPNGARTLLPVPGAETSVQSAELALSFGETERWQGGFAFAELQAGDLRIGALTIDADGTGQNLQGGGARAIDGQITGRAEQISGHDPELAELLAEGLDFAMQFNWRDGAPLTLQSATLSGAGAQVALAGDVAALAFDGTLRADVAALAPFGAVAQRSLNGAARFEAAGKVAPLTGAFDLRLDGSATDLRLDDPRLDRLLAGTTVLQGRVVRDTEGFRADRFRFGNPQVDVTADGIFATEGADFRLNGRLSELAMLVADISGAAQIALRATGRDGANEVMLRADIPSGQIRGKALTGATVGFDGTVVGLNKVDGKLSGRAQLQEMSARLDGRIVLDGVLLGLREFALRAGQTQIEGDLLRGGDGLIAGRATVRSPDLRPAAELFLQDIAGAVDVDLSLFRAAGQQSATLRGRISNIAAFDTLVGSGTVAAQIEDLFGVPLVNGRLDATSVEVGGLSVATLQADALTADDTMDISARARLSHGTNIDTDATIRSLAPGFEVDLQRLQLDQEDVTARLTAPAKLRVVDGVVQLGSLALDLAGGALTVAGRVGETLALDLMLDAVPLSLANTVMPSLGLEGTVSGTAVLSGTPAAPDADFDLTAADVHTALARENDLPKLGIALRGATEAQRLALEAELDGGGRSFVRLAGSVPVVPDAGALDLRADIPGLPLAIFDRLAGRIGLQGTLTGQADISGALDAPVADFGLNGQGLSVRQSRDLGISSFDVTAEGQADTQSLDLRSVVLRSAQGLRLTARGVLPFGRAGHADRRRRSGPAVAGQLLAGGTLGPVGRHGNADDRGTWSRDEPAPRRPGQYAGGTICRSPVEPAAGGDRCRCGAVGRPGGAAQPRCPLFARRHAARVGQFAIDRRPASGCDRRDPACQVHRRTAGGDHGGCGSDL